ncbi:MAG: kelch repeat-containing protein [Candidatus Thermoplasmatota archaeon]
MRKILLIALMITFVNLFVFIPTNTNVNASSTWTQSTDTDFSGGILDNIVIKGTGVDARLELAKKSWTNKNPTTKPSSRSGHAMAAIYNDDKVVLFGGYYGTGYLDDTWVYDLSDNTWINKTLATKPFNRDSHAMAAIYNDDKVVLFGGWGGGARWDDTWVYDLSDNTWTNKAPVTKPFNRDSHAMATIYNDDKVVLFSGSGLWDDTWVYDLSDNTWTNKAPATKPSGRSLYAMAAIYNDDKVVLFGGWDGANYQDDTWVYDLSDNTWTNKAPATKPSTRYDHAMATIYNDDKVMLFGGYGSCLDDTWVYDLSDNTWTNKAPATKPSGRSEHAMATIYNDDKVILFGGDDGAYDDETWVYDLTADYSSSGNFISSYYDTGGDANFWSISWNATVPTDTELKFQVRTAKKEADLLSKSFVGPDGNTGTYYTASGATIYSGHKGDRWIQYKAYISTKNLNLTPTLNDLTIAYNLIPLQPSPISPPNGQWLNNSKPTFSWKFNDTDGLQEEFNVQIDDDINFGSIDYTSNNVSSSKSNWIPLIPIPDGTWYWRVKTKDNDGDWSDYNKDIWCVKIDTIPPYLNITEPANGSVTNEKELYINGNTEPNVTVEINGSEVEVIDSKFRYKIALTEGNNQIKISAYDKAGNEKSLIINVVLELINGWIEGKVHSGILGPPIENAVVMVNETMQSQLTNASGYFNISIPPGKYNITVSASGHYDYYLKNVKVTGGNTTAINIFMDYHKGNLNGRVKDATTGKAIPYAFVTPEGYILGSMTDEQGNYNIKDMKVGTIKIVCTAIGYENMTKTVTIKKDTTETLDFALSPIAAKVGVNGTVYPVKDKILDKRTIQAKEYIAYKMDLHYKDKIRIKLEVLNGTGVGILIMDSEAFSKMKEMKEFWVDETNSRGVNRSINYTWAFPLSDQTYYIVIANFRLIGDVPTRYVTNAPVTYQIEIENLSYGKRGVLVSQAILIPFLILIVIFVLTGFPSFLLIRAVRAMREMPAQFEQAIPFKKFTKGKVIGLVGGLIGVVGVFLPWVGVFGIGISGFFLMFIGGILFFFWGLVPLILGVTGIVLVIMSRKKTYIGSCISGMFVSLMPIIFIGISLTLMAQAYASPEVFISALQPGIFITITGGVILMLGSLLGLREIRGTFHPWVVPVTPKVSKARPSIPKKRVPAAFPHEARAPLEYRERELPPAPAYAKPAKPKPAKIAFCKICNNPIPKEKIVNCRCGMQFHALCIFEQKSCSECGTEYVKCSSCRRLAIKDERVIRCYGCKKFLHKKCIRELENCPVCGVGLRRIV